MNPTWRTETVVALCRRMLDLRDFSAMPILADALQEAGCTDEVLLAQCQDPKLEQVEAERLANLLFSDETASAVAWLEKFGVDISYETEDDEPPMYDYASVVAVGQEGATSGEMFFGTDAGADFFREGEENTREFFRNWSLVTGRPVPEEVKANLAVGCAC